MAMNSALLLLARSTTTAALLTVKGWFVAVYYVADVGLYFLYRTVRRDFLTHQPAGGLGETLLATLLHETAAKLMADFTGLVMMRASTQLGGAYYTLNMITALGCSFVAVHVYYAYIPAGALAAVEQSTAWILTIALTASWFFVFIVFLSTINRKFLGTFVSVQTGRERIERVFLDNTEDEKKAAVFKYNPAKWTAIREEVKEWCLDGWLTWKETQPEWFTDVWIDCVDDDMIPPEAMRELEDQHGGLRRRSSVRASLRLSGVVPTIPGSDQE